VGNAGVALLTIVSLPQVGLAAVMAPFEGLTSGTSGRVTVPETST
jgi:hypothetical protein